MKRWGGRGVVLCVWLCWTGTASADATLDEIRAMLAAGDKQGALDALKPLSRSSREPDVFLYLGVLHRERDQLELAIRVFRQGLQIAPSHENLTLELAVTLSWSGQLDEAIATYESLLVSKPNNRAAVLGRARVLAWAGRHEEALAVYRRVLRDSPDEIEALRGIAFVLRSRMRYGEAREYYTRVLAMDPDDTEAREGMGQIDEATRWEAEGGLGVVHFRDGITSLRGYAVFGYTHDPELKLVASYESDVPSGFGASVGDNLTTPAHSARAGLVYRFGPRFTSEAQYEFRIQAPRLIHRLIFRGSLSLSRHWVALAGVRPGVSHDGRPELLADGGIQLLPDPLVWMMAQCFGYADKDGQRTWTVVGTAWWQWASFASVRTGAGRGGINGDTSLSFFVGQTFVLSDRVDLKLQYEQLHSSLQRYAGTGAVAVRF